MQISAINSNNSFKGYGSGEVIDVPSKIITRRPYDDEDLTDVMDKYEKLKTVSKKNLTVSSPMGRFATVVIATLSTGLIASKLSAKAIKGIEKALPLEQPLNRLGERISKSATELAGRKVADVTTFKTFFAETSAKLKKFTFETLEKIGKKGLAENATKSQIMVNGINQALAKTAGLATGATVLAGSTRDKDKDGIADAFQISEDSINNKKGVLGFLSNANDVCEAAGAFLGAA